MKDLTEEILIKVSSTSSQGLNFFKCKVRIHDSVLEAVDTKCAKGGQPIFDGLPITAKDATFASCGITHKDTIVLAQEAGSLNEKIWYRFRADYSSSWYVNNESWDAINFKTTGNISFIGFVSFGPMEGTSDFALTWKIAINDEF